MKKKMILLMVAVMLFVAPAGASFAEEALDEFLVVEEESAEKEIVQEETVDTEADDEKQCTTTEACEDKAVYTDEVSVVSVEEMEGPLDEAATVSTIAKGTCGDNLTWKIDDEGVLTISGTGEMAKSINSEGEISTPWSEYSDQIKKIVIKNGVTTISAYAFMGLFNLESVSIADSVQSIGQTAFNGSTLKEITIPDSVTSLGTAAFASCSNLTKVVLSSELTVISDSTFAGCSSLNNVVIPDSVTTIGEYAFYNCTSLTDITIESSVTSFGLKAFDGTPWLENLGDLAIYNTVLLRYLGSASSITIPEGVTAIGDGAFYECSSVTNAVIPEGVVSIGAYAFSCSGLKTVTIAKSVTSIGYAAVGYGEFATSYDITIYGYTGSTAETYAASDKHFTFVALDGGIVALEKGKISSLTNTSAGIKIKWNEVSGADGYYIYRKTSSGSYSKIKTIKSGSTTSYTDKKIVDNNGTTYTYKVVPYSGSTKGSGSAKTTVRLTGTSLKSLTNSATTKVKVKWTAVSNVTGYQIQYSTSSSFSSYKTKKVSGATSASKALSSLTMGKTYYVRIRTYKTVNGTTYYSAWSSKLKVKVLK